MLSKFFWIIFAFCSKRYNNCLQSLAKRTTNQPRLMPCVGRAVIHRGVQWKRVVQSCLWMKLSHNGLLPKTHLCQNCDRALLSTPVHRCRLFIREPRIHAPLGIQTWNVINMRLNKRLGHNASKMWFCVYIWKFEFSVWGETTHEPSKAT